MVLPASEILSAFAGRERLSRIMIDVGVPSGETQGTTQVTFVSMRTPERSSIDI